MTHPGSSPGDRTNKEGRHLRVSALFVYASQAELNFAARARSPKMQDKTAAGKVAVFCVLDRMATVCYNEENNISKEYWI